MAARLKAVLRTSSGADFFPLFFEAARGDGGGGAELLGEEVDAEFFEHPAEGGELRVGEGDGVVVGFAAEVVGPEGGDDGAARGIAVALCRALVFEFFQTEAHRGEIPRQMRKPLCWRAE